MPKKHLFIWLIFAIACFFLFYKCNPKKPKPEDAFFLNLNDTVNYVGISECRKCHEDHYKTFIETGMGSSFGPVSRLRSKANFNHIKPIYDAKTNYYYYPFFEDTVLKIMEFRLRGKDTVHKRVETIKYIIGSGHHTNSHLWMDNGYLYQAPLTWYVQEKKWDLPPGYEVTNTRFSRVVEMECMSCHNAMPSVEKGSLNKFTQLPAGIDCERCHGPGELHVQRKLNGEIVNTKTTADRTIVNPSRLPWKLQVDVCQRCHLQGNNVLKTGKKFTDFRPGMHLDSVFTVFMPLHGEKKSFVMAGHSERMQLSACFKGSNNSNIEAYNPQINFTCITCHNPHVSVRKTNIAKFNNACINCHQEKGISKLKKCTEKPEKLKITGNNCVQCHMPSSGTSDIPHVTVHDHFIRRPDKIKRIETEGNITGIYAVNNATTDKETYARGLITYFEKFKSEPVLMQKAAPIVAENTTNQSVLLHYYYANQSWDKIVAMIPGIDSANFDAWSLYRVGKSLDLTDNISAATAWYKKAYLKEKLNIGFTTEYANNLIRNKRYKEARGILEIAIKEQQKQELLYQNLGTIEMLEGNISKAKNLWLKCVQLNPDNEFTRLYLAELYLKVGEMPEAKKELIEALRINPKNTKAQELFPN